MTTNVQLKADESNPSILLREHGAALDAWFVHSTKKSAVRKRPTTSIRLPSSPSGCARENARWKIYMAGK